MPATFLIFSPADLPSTSTSASMPGVVPVPIIVSSFLSLSRPTMSQLIIMTVEFEREQGVRDIVLRAEQPALLARERDEDDPAGQGVAAGTQPACQLEHHRGPRRVVVGPVVDVAREDCQRPGHQSPVAQVVVVAADHDRLVGVRPGPFQNADHVLGLDPLAARSSILAVEAQPLSSRERGFRSSSICFSRSAERGLAGRVPAACRRTRGSASRTGGSSSTSIPTGRKLQATASFSPSRPGQVVDQQDRGRAVLERVGRLVLERRVCRSALPSNGLASSSC